MGTSVATDLSVAAQLLLAARHCGRRIAALPDDVRPRTVADAYRIQDAVVSKLGAVGGWKVGAKSRSAEPTCAPLPASLILRSPHRFTADRFADNGVEAELAFTLSHDLPPRAQPYRVAEMAEAVSG